MVMCRSIYIPYVYANEYVYVNKYDVYDYLHWYAHKTVYMRICNYVCGYL